MSELTTANLANYMRRRVLLALFCLAALAAGSLWFGWQVFGVYLGGAEMINVCGRQRLLTQRIAAASDGLTEARDEEQVEFWRRTLLLAHDEMETAQKLLSRAVKERTAETHPLQPLFFSAPVNLDARSHEFLNLALLQAQNSRGAPLEQRSRDTTELALQAEAFGPLMNGYEAATKIFQSVVETGKRRQIKIQATATAATFLLLVLLWAVVFRPMRDSIVHLNIQLEDLAVRDELTKLYNRRKLNEMLEHEIGLAHRHGAPLSMIIFDLDHFKRVNDTCGHQMGDAVLRETAAEAARQIRGTDTLARWGGEEFCLVLPHTALTAAVSVAEKVRRALDGAPLPCSQRITASFGAAELRPDETPEQLAGRADAALYRAKENGRNRVERDG